MDFNRRKVLAAIGTLPFLGSNPVRMLLSSMVNGLIRDAQATSTGSEQPRKYIFVGLPSAPPRWYFDLALNPYSNGSELIKNGMVNTGFSDSGDPTTAGQVTYKTVPIQIAGQTIRMPSLWASTIPTTSQGWVPMSSLMSNMLIIRGLNMRQDGHGLNFVKMTRPSTAAASLSGLVADDSDTPIPAVGLSNSNPDGYSSRRGVGIANLSYSDPLTQLLGPFDRRSDSGLATGWLTRRQAMDGAIQSALSALCDYAKSTHPGAESLCSDRNRAEKLLREGVGNLASEYQTLKTKYSTLVFSCLDPSQPMPGITDKKILPGNYSNEQLLISTTIGANNPGKNPDLRNIFVPNTTSVSALAEYFAVAEYVIRRGYSSTVSGGLGNVIGCNFQGITATSWTTDEHEAGSVMSLLVNSFRFRALSACLYELIRVFTSDGIFGETVIQVGAEFTRRPKNNQTGSDHGWEGNVMSLWSGAISNPYVIGNTMADPAATYSGSWGKAAPGKIDGAQIELGIGHATSTVAQLLRVQPPMNNNMPVLLETGGRISLTTDLAKNL